MKSNATVSIYTMTTEVLTTGKISKTKQYLAHDQRALVLGLPGRAKLSMIGKIEGAQYTFSWSGRRYSEGVIVEYDCREFELCSIIDDTTRPLGPVGAYYSGILKERRK